MVTRPRTRRGGRQTDGDDGFTLMELLVGTCTGMIDPSQGNYHFQLGKALHQHGQDERAVKAYQMSISLDPSDPAPYLSLGVRYEGLDRRSDAVGAYRRDLDLAPASPPTTALRWHVVAIMESQERARAGG